MKLDLFCRVVDNWGDLGVCWRLARQLTEEFDFEVRLIVDDLSPFEVIAPDVDRTVERQTFENIDIVRWDAFADSCEADWVIEAFACDPPETYVQSMTQCSPQPFWINIEYLSAENWVDGVHEKPSPHPRLPLTKYFFVPGFTPASGGLIREEWVTTDTARAAKKASAHSVNCFVFTYAHAPVDALARGFAQASMTASFAVAAELTTSLANVDHVRIATVPQSEFDTLLGTFDLLLVRGEDSFVRAQFAGKPMLWHIYPTEDRAHIKKLDAWLNRYCADMDDQLTEVYRRASHAFVDPQAMENSEEAFRRLASRIEALRAHAIAWQRKLFAMPDLAGRLVEFSHRIEGD
jgi:uncharacterized repeat protein (TIGR03837 family)